MFSRVTSVDYQENVNCDRIQSHIRSQNDRECMCTIREECGKLES